MARGLSGIIDQLERQKTAIERALTALRQIEGIAAPATAAAVKLPATAEAPTRKRRKFSAASRRKMALAQKARWAKIKGEIEPPSPRTPEPPKPKRRISAEGMKRIIAATKKRWRLQKAAARASAA
jgi:integrase